MQNPEIYKLIILSYEAYRTHRVHIILLLTTSNICSTNLLKRYRYLMRNIDVASVEKYSKPIII